MLHTQYVFVYRDTYILVINSAPPNVEYLLRHCLKLSSQNIIMVAGGREKKKKIYIYIYNGIHKSLGDLI